MFNDHAESRQILQTEESVSELNMNEPKLSGFDKSYDMLKHLDDKTMLPKLVIGKL